MCTVITDHQALSHLYYDMQDTSNMLPELVAPVLGVYVSLRTFFFLRRRLVTPNETRTKLKTATGFEPSRQRQYEYELRFDSRVLAVSSLDLQRVHTPGLPDK